MKIKVTMPISEVTGNGSFATMLDEMTRIDSDLVTNIIDGAHMQVSNIELNNSIAAATFTPALLTQIVGVGGDIEAFPVWFKMTKAYADATDVPASLPNRTYTPEGGAETVYKWSQWHDANHVAFEANDGGTDVIVIAGNSWGEELSASQAVGALDTPSGATITIPGGSVSVVGDSNVQLMTATEFTAWREQFNGV